MSDNLRAAVRMLSFPERIASLLVAGIILSLAGFATGVWLIRSNSNERAAEESVRLVESHLGNLQDALSNVAIDYNHWDDAHQAMMAGGDLRWIYDNYATSAVNATLFEGVVFSGGPFASPIAWTAAHPQVGPSPSFLPPRILELVEQEVARHRLGILETFDMMTELEGQLVLLSAARIQPRDLMRLEGLDPATLPVAILADVLDNAGLAEIAGSLHLEHMTFSPQPGMNQSSLPIVGAKGETVGFLSWTPPRPGDEIVTTMAPVLGAAALIFVVLGGLAAGLARSHVRHLVSAETHAQHIALHDPLTGLPNRRCFYQRVEEMLGQMRAGHDERSLAVLLLDLDRFKPVNDLRGHHAGDALLRSVADRLRRACPEGALVARLGGDEFVVTLSGPNAEDHAGEVAARILAALADPFDLSDWSATISCSIGVAHWSPGLSPSDLLRQADQAMYCAKQAGRAGYAYYDEVLGATQRERAALEQDLRRALQAETITPHFQPIYDIASQELRGFEVLSRWNDAARGFVPPDVFIGLAEEIGLIDSLSEQVLDKACAALVRWPTDLPISFNLSPGQMADRGLPDRILAILARHGLPGSRLEIEITERALVADLVLASQVIGKLTAAGVRISLDDFGTGTSSLALLMQLPIDSLKIDRSFITNVDKQPRKAKIVSGVLALADSLGLDVTAEGIERHEELAFLRERSCALAQGYLLGRPQSARSIAELLDQTATATVIVPRFASA